MAQYHQPHLYGGLSLPPALSIRDLSIARPSAAEVEVDVTIRYAPNLEASVGSIVKPMESVNSNIGSPSGLSRGLWMSGLGDDPNPRDVFEQPAIPPTSPSSAHRSTSPPPVRPDRQVQPTHENFMLDDFSITWTDNPKHWESVLNGILSFSPGPLLPADQSTEDPGTTEEVSDGTNTKRPIDDEVLTIEELCDAIDKTSRSISHYREAVLRLAERCRILKNTLKFWEGHYKRTCPDLPLSTLPAFMLTQLVSERGLKQDLIRILEFLRSLKGQQLEFFQDSSLFPRVFKNAAKFLVSPRLFIRYSESALRKVDQAFEIALLYDRADMLAAARSTS